MVIVGKEVGVGGGEREFLENKRTWGELRKEWEGRAGKYCTYMGGASLIGYFGGLRDCVQISPCGVS